jgi:hypothetical protein
MSNRYAKGVCKLVYGYRARNLYYLFFHFLAPFCLDFYMSV